MASKVVLSVRKSSADGLPWYFVWNPEGSKKTLRMYPPLREGKDSTISTELLETFRKKLRKLGFILDDNKSRSTEFDGFDETDGILQNRIDVRI
ncbi:MAG: hypothetical protein Kow009_08380 [Spirochaetales bacterium]